MAIFYELGIASKMYWSCYIVGFITIFIFNGFYAKKYNISALKAVAFSIVSYALIFAWAYVLAWVINGFEWGHHNAIRVYVWMPVVLWLVGKLFRIKWSTACEFIAPSACLVYAISRLGCVFAGCCYGIPASWGIFSTAAGYNCFPVQLWQSIASFIIFGITLYLAKRKNYTIDQKLYPQMLIMYGGARFLLDFMQDNEKLFSGVSELALWGLLCVIIGFAWLAIIRNKQKSRTVAVSADD